MKQLWKFIDKKNWTAKRKIAAAFMIIGTLAALAGLAVWLGIRNMVLTSPKWCICFMGYPVMVSWFAVYLYYCNHVFHEGSC